MDDIYKKSYHFVFPSKAKGQLCFVAHNMILHNLLESDKTPYEELKTLQKIYGVHHYADATELPGHKLGTWNVSFIRHSLSISKRYGIFSITK